MKTLSVVVPNYNHSQWLPRSLGAIAAQADAATEIIVVDDGSTDGSVEIIERLRQQYPAIRLIRHDRNRGVVAAMRTGLEVASGDYSIMSAADDLVLPGLFAKAVGALRANPRAAFFCSGVVIVDPDDRIVGFRPATPPRASAGYLSPADVRRAIRRTDNWFVGSSVVYRHERLAGIGYFDASLESLTDGMANRLLAFRDGFYYEPEVLSAWRRYPESLSGRVALSESASERSLLAAEQWIDKNFPPDVRSDYGKLFDLRFRFNMARLRLIWGAGPPDWRGLSKLLRLGPVDSSVLRALSLLPALSTKLMLAWITLRLQPFSLSALAAAWWRNLSLDRVRRTALQPLLRSPAEASAGKSVSLTL